MYIYLGWFSFTDNKNNIHSISTLMMDRTITKTIANKYWEGVVGGEI